MKKRIVTFVGIVLTFALVCATTFDFNKKSDRLVKINIADAYVTCWTVLYKFSLFRKLKIN